ncbi:SixA phosphatase family protein [Silvimonas amylolytica]|uniref:Histidine phosphatase family protein n=1 Tax=Silvimonas amylolytica TaxID=449663 RepID=A0ABQ2PL60_9NEIS|nr:histidine phosphatase family protein [Silvimonas amylolytica]GGP25709.1 histidine phosphatase family protein [Silvimonas amylolytica]
MDLILWRHAEAEDGSPDLKRALTRHGHAQARLMAQWLAPRLAQNTVRIVASEALRAQQTASALSTEFLIDERLNPDVRGPADYLDVTGWPAGNDGDITILVAHQPTIGRLAGLLLTGLDQDLSTKKGAIWWIQRRLRGGAVQYCLRASISPDLLQNS